MLEPLAGAPVVYDVVCIVTSVLFAATGAAMLLRVRPGVGAALLAAGVASVLFRSCRAGRATPWWAVRRLCYVDHTTALTAIAVCAALVPRQRALILVGAACMLLARHAGRGSASCAAHTLGHACMAAACAWLLLDDVAAPAAA